MNKGLQALAIVAGAGVVMGIGISAYEYLTPAPMAWEPPPPPPTSYPAPELETTTRKLLFEARYEELERLLEQLRQDYARDPANEYRLNQAYGGFEDAEHEAYAAIAAWIKQRPDSVEAILARGVQRAEAAWARRGGKASKDVADQAMADFARLLELSRKDVEATLSKSPEHPIAWRFLIRAYCGTEGADGLDSLYARIERRAGASYLAHRTVLIYLQPRWGGSYELMEKYAEAAQAWRAKNPRLEVLRGFPFWAAGFTAHYDGKPEKAVEYYDRALSHGEDPDFLEGRSDSLIKLLRFKQAFADMARQHELFPTRESQANLEGARERMRKVAYYLHANKKDAQALKAYDAFLEVWPDDEGVLHYRRALVGS